MKTAPCKICQDPRRAEIDAAVAAGDDRLAVAQRFAVTTRKLATHEQHDGRPETENLSSEPDLNRKTVKARWDRRLLRRGVSSETVYIYGLTDPRDGRIVYVGRSHDPKRRLMAHRAGARTNLLLSVLCADLDLVGLRFGMVILYVVPPGIEIADIEAMAIEQHGGVADLQRRIGRRARGLLQFNIPM